MHAENHEHFPRLASNNPRGRHPILSAGLGIRC
jgi:hypothetical protein